ncbi:MAG: hydrolase [Sphingomonas bacterium]|nr:NUDIX hydrolase [Sphingomonas bacterium]MDB5688315.1 hydrolase [Sphingomonas bacterium]
MQWLFRLLAQVGCGLDDRNAGPGGAALQVGALPYAIDTDGAVRVLLITSRRSARWIAPKGWPVRGLTLAEGAAKEAFEEAGVRGKAGEPIGLIPPARDGRGAMSPAILIHPLRVETELATWPERGQRQRRWLPPEEAAELAASPLLAAMIRSLIQLLQPPAGAAGYNDGHDPAGGPWPQS